MASRSEILEIGHKIAMAGTPYRCNGCIEPYLNACTIAGRVVSGELDLSAATKELQTDLDDNCPQGFTTTEACLGDDLVCNYGDLDPVEILN